MPQHIKRLGTILKPLKANILENIPDNAQVALSLPVPFEVIQDNNKETLKDAIAKMLMFDTSRWSVSDLEYTPTSLINDKVNDRIAILLDVKFILHDTQKPVVREDTNHKYLLVSHEEGILSPDCKTAVFDSLDDAVFTAKCEILQSYIDNDEIMIDIEPLLDDVTGMPVYDEQGKQKFDVTVDYGDLGTEPGDSSYAFPTTENGWHGFNYNGTGAEWQIFEV